MGATRGGRRDAVRIIRLTLLTAAALCLACGDTGTWTGAETSTVLPAPADNDRPPAETSAAVPRGYTGLRTVTPVRPAATLPVPAQTPEAATTPETNGEPAATPGTNGEPAATPGTNGEPAATPGTNGEPAATPGTNGEPAATPGTNGEPAATPGTNGEPTATPGTNGEPAATPETNGEPATTPETNGEPARTPTTERTAAETPEAGPAPRLTEEQTDQPGRPVNPGLTMTAIGELSQDERDCLPADVRAGDIELDLTSIVSVRHTRILKAVADCVSDENLVRLTVFPGLRLQTRMTDGEATCIAAGSSGRMIRRALSESGEFQTFSDAIFLAKAAAALNARSCLDPERTGLLSLTKGEAALLECLLEGPEGAETLMDTVLAGSPEAERQLRDKADACGRSIMDRMPAEPHRTCEKTQEQPCLQN